MPEPKLGCPGDGAFLVHLPRATCLVEVERGIVVKTARYLWRWRGKQASQVGSEAEWLRLPEIPKGREN